MAYVMGISIWFHRNLYFDSVLTSEKFCNKKRKMKIFGLSPKTKVGTEGIRRKMGHFITIQNIELIIWAIKKIDKHNFAAQKLLYLRNK